ncbi:hypothetical protein GIB67_021040 [Kingdonia uniflora]|uniref:Heat shock protein 90 n=1 Tax=Kingdonia uniflora TaxID=39325 RepID=A0A7J7N6Q1_9MAGN|nr:hypothetical protein GIB67_021040 [Kingdonia uniflora]
MNNVKAVWLRTPKEVTDEEYAKFYWSLAKYFSEEKPLSWSHFTAEGNAEFKAHLFVPPKAPHNLYESYYNSSKSNLKLYVRRVFISDEFDELLLKIAEEDPDEYSDKEKTDVEASDKDEKFESIKSGGKLASLDQYISRMKAGQKDILYITRTNKEQLEKSPFLERLTKKNYEVIFFTDSVDEYLMQYLMEYEDKKFQNVSKEGLKLGKDSKDKEVKDTFKDLTKWWKDVLVSENVDSVKISNRLDNSPCVVVTSKYGWTANMERIMQSPTFLDANKQAYMHGKRVLEINPRHLIIKELRERVISDPEDESVKQTAKLVYQTSLMESGFVLSDPKEFANNIYNSVKRSLKISSDATIYEEIEADEAEKVETPKEAKEEDAAVNEDADTEPSIVIVSVFNSGAVCSYSFFASLSSMALLVL